MIVELVIAGVVSLGVIAVVRASLGGFLSLAARPMIPAKNQAFRGSRRRRKFLAGPE
jgi:hypothetical protein